MYKFAAYANVSLGIKAAAFSTWDKFAAAHGLDSESALAQSLYATHGPEGVMDVIHANPELRSGLLGGVRNIHPDVRGSGPRAPGARGTAIPGIGVATPFPKSMAASGEIMSPTARALHTISLPRPPALRR